MNTTTKESALDMEKLYKDYGRTTDAEIRELLKRIILVSLTSKGVGSKYGYYAFTEESMAKIQEKPRNVSHTWDPKPGEYIKKRLREFKRLPFLVKSSSRFFLKPDIGEVFDAMDDDDKKRTMAIYTLTDSECVNASGDEFICTAILLE